MSAWLYGLGTGFSLIAAIGVQNAFVIKQGLKKEHVFWVCLVCALSDSILVSLGIMGFAKVVNAYPQIVTLAKYFGATFLIWYGAKSFYAAFYKNDVLNPSNIEKSSRWAVIGACLAFTWLNPHVYLDTVVLIGSIAMQFEGQRVAFAAGVLTASWVFFFALGYGARVLLPLFQKAISWKILDFLVGLMMWIIALTLLLNE